MRTIVVASILVTAALIVGLMLIRDQDQGSEHDNYRAVTYRSFVDGTAYKMTVSMGNLRKSPSWKEHGSPPVSPGKALELARMKLESTVPEAKDWELRMICLQPTLISDKWIYAVEFNPPL